MVEVLVATFLIAVGLGSILSMNARSAHSLRAARQTAAASQLMQQRLEMIRSRPWPEVTSSEALSTVMHLPTESEKELSDHQFLETLTVSIPPGVTPAEPNGATTFTLKRRKGLVIEAPAAADLGAEPLLVYESTITWKDKDATLERKLRTLVCRAGLTRSGIFGSDLGRALVETPARRLAQ